MRRRPESSGLLRQGEQLWSQGRARQAFKALLNAAKAGSVPAFGLVGYFYDDGIGTKRDEEEALYWYKRASRHGNDTAANNIGVIWRDRGDLRRAVRWFERAVSLGDGDANLNIAKIYLRTARGRRRAERFLRATCRARSVTQGSLEEAKHLLRSIRVRRN